MRTILLLLFLAPFPLELFAADLGHAGNWSEVIDSGEGRYSLLFEPDENRVDVTQLDRGKALPSEMKIRIHQRGDRPLDLKLKAIDNPNEAFHYQGTSKEWDGSVMGFEVEMRFDKKTLKKVKRFFGGAAH